MKTTTWRALCGAAALWAGCKERPPSVSYSLAGNLVHARVEAEFTAERDDGKGPGYRSKTEALIRLRRLDISGGLLAVELTVDSVDYSGSERDSGETFFMRQRLRRFRATWHMAPDGSVLDLVEEPELPRGDLAVRFGPLLAAALPVFPSPDSSATVVDTQSLFDPVAPEARLVKSQSSPDGEARGQVRGKRRIALRLYGGPAGGAELEGESSFRFDPALGFPREITLDARGALPPDSAGGFQFSTRLRFRLRFEVLESARR